MSLSLTDVISPLAALFPFIIAITQIRKKTFLFFSFFYAFFLKSDRKETTLVKAESGNITLSWEIMVHTQVGHQHTDHQSQCQHT